MSKLSYKIAILNPYSVKKFGYVAEHESSRRIEIVAKKLGYHAKEINSSDDLDKFNPDFVLSISHQDPKLTKYPTYGVLTAPINFYDTPRFKTNIFSYDGIFTISEKVKDWIDFHLACVGKINTKVGYYANSCQIMKFQDSIDFKNARLVYCGTNWDKSRFENLFKNLDNSGKIAIYGPKKSWQKQNLSSYKGMIPFDGTSMIEVYRKFGAGLCLYHEEFARDGLPTNRIFEISCAGAVAISGKNDFSEIFGDNIINIDQSLDCKKVQKQIEESLNWIRSNPDLAEQKAKNMNTIFRESLSLEKLLQNVISYHEEFVSRNKNIEVYTDNKNNKEDQGYIYTIIRCGNISRINFLRESIESLKNQYYKKIIPVVIIYNEAALDKIKKILEEFKEDFKNIEILESFNNPDRVSTLWLGLKKVKSLSNDNGFVAILDDDDFLFPNHYSSLIEKYNDLKKSHGKDYLIYSGHIIYDKDGIKNITKDKNYIERKVNRDIKFFKSISKQDLLNGSFFSCSFICPIRSIRDSLLLVVPKYIKIGEDLFFILNVFNNNFAFSTCVTCVERKHSNSRSNYEVISSREYINPYIENSDLRPSLSEQSSIQMHHKSLYKILWRSFMTKTRFTRHLLEKLVFSFDPKKKLPLSGRGLQLINRK